MVVAVADVAVVVAAAAGDVAVAAVDVVAAAAVAVAVAAVVVVAAAAAVVVVVVVVAAVVDVAEAIGVVEAQCGEETFGDVVGQKVVEIDVNPVPVRLAFAVIYVAAKIVNNLHQSPLQTYLLSRCPICFVWGGLGCTIG
jgi:hypothetical protein